MVCSATPTASALVAVLARALAQPIAPEATPSRMTSDRFVGAAAPPGVEPARDFRVWLLGGILALLLRLRHMTWHKNTGELAAIDRRLAAGERVLAVFWHGNYVPLFSLLSGRKACVFASDSFRGRVIAEICRRFGYSCVLLPDRGGRRSRELLRAGLSPHRAGALAVDGPLGPYHVVKSGAIEFASELGFQLVPVAVAATPSQIEAGRWDKMEIPRLFARVYLAVGEPVAIPPVLDSAAVPALQAEVAKSLEALTVRARKALGLAPQQG